MKCELGFSAGVVGGGLLTFMSEDKNDFRGDKGGACRCGRNVREDEVN